MKRIYAPIDNKNLMEDAFEDEVFRNFYAAPGHRKHNLRKLIGSVKTENYDAIVDVWWHYGDHIIAIRLLGYQPQEDLDEVREEVMKHYERVFKAWQCDDNPGLIVETKRMPFPNIMTVSFYYENDN